MYLLGCNCFKTLFYRREIINPLTRKIRNKGYTLKQFLEKIGFSLRWYRTHEIKGAARNDELNDMIDNLEDKQDAQGDRDGN
jgi:hypothetical protein